MKIFCNELNYGGNSYQYYKLLRTSQVKSLGLAVKKWQTKVNGRDGKITIMTKTGSTLKKRR
jgi:hypothetical protein